MPAPGRFKGETAISLAPGKRPANQFESCNRIDSRSTAGSVMSMSRFKVRDSRGVLRVLAVNPELDHPVADLVAAAAFDYEGGCRGDLGHLCRIRDVELLAVDPVFAHPAAEPEALVGPVAGGLQVDDGDRPDLDRPAGPILGKTGDAPATQQLGAGNQVEIVLFANQADFRPRVAQDVADAAGEVQHRALVVFAQTGADGPVVELEDVPVTQEARLRLGRLEALGLGVEVVLPAHAPGVIAVGEPGLGLDVERLAIHLDPALG